MVSSLCIFYIHSKSSCFVIYSFSSMSKIKGFLLCVFRIQPIDLESSCLHQIKIRYVTPISPIFLGVHFLLLCYTVLIKELSLFVQREFKFFGPFKIHLVNGFCCIIILSVIIHHYFLCRWFITLEFLTIEAFYGIVILIILWMFLFVYKINFIESWKRRCMWCYCMNGICISKLYFNSWDCNDQVNVMVNVKIVTH